MEINKFLMTFALAIFVIGILAFVSGVFADSETNSVNDSENAIVTIINTNEINASFVPKSQNMTYGRCVSELTRTRDSCYKQGKSLFKTCNSGANKDKSMQKNCKQGFKQSSLNCKQNFSDAKVNCKQYKKTFADKLRFWR